MIINYGDETVCFFELSVPRCSLTYASAPCTAVLGTTGTRKCFNTRKTCQSIANFTPTSTTTLRFSRPQNGIDAYGPLIPSMQEVSIAPMTVNLAGMNEHSTPFGQREQVTITLDDHLHSDIQLDNYRLERYSGAAQSSGVGYDPAERGTFWGKFLARNPYYINMPCVLRVGKIGDALADMRVQHYILTSIDGPNDGQVRLTLKDTFSLIETKKAVAPLPSKGRLLADITDVAGTATLTPLGIGATYSSSGFLRISQEVMAFTRVGDVLTLTARHAVNTVAAAHSAEDAVQEVLAFVTQRAHDIAYTLMSGYTEVPASSISLANWAAAAASLLNLYTAYITEPTPVADLLGELEQQVGFTLWPDVIDNTIHFKPLVASTPTQTVDDSKWIVEKSLQLKRDASKRVSLVAVYYGQVDPTKDVEEETNYRSRVISIDSSGNYDTDSVRKVFSRWIPQFGRTVAQASGDRILAMFTDPPLEAKFKYHVSRSGDLQLAELFYLSAAETQDDTGAASTVTMAPVSIMYGEDEDTCGAQEVRLAAPVDPATERVIYIDSDTYNINLRSAFDSIYPAPTGVEAVTFEITAGIKVGSTSSTLPAITTGVWPVGVMLKLRNYGRVNGRGGDGGHGGGCGGNGSPGQNGGDAIQATRALTIDNQGQLRAGGPGGGGGGGGSGSGTGGGGGGGGGGFDGGSGGAKGIGCTGNTVAQDGAAGGLDAGGLRGEGGAQVFNNSNGSDGGSGGAPGASASAGTNSVAGFSGGAAGTGGRYIVGSAFITWLNLGDVIGGVA